MPAIAGKPLAPYGDLLGPGRAKQDRPRGGSGDCHRLDLAWLNRLAGTIKAGRTGSE